MGAVYGEIPLFGPGAGSAASAGVTDSGAGMTGEGGRVGMAAAVAWGLGAVHVEIPAASAGMTDLGARV